MDAQDLRLTIAVFSSNFRANLKQSVKNFHHLVWSKLNRLCKVHFWHHCHILHGYSKQNRGSRGCEPVTKPGVCQLLINLREEEEEEVENEEEEEPKPSDSAILERKIMGGSTGFFQKIQFQNERKTFIVKSRGGFVKM